MLGKIQILLMHLYVADVNTYTVGRNSSVLTCGMQSPIITPQKPYRFPRAVLVSIATSIHLLRVSARSASVAHVSMVTATRSFRHSVLPHIVTRKRNLQFCEGIIQQLYANTDPLVPVCTKKVFLTLELNGDKLSTSYHGHFTPGEGAHSTHGIRG